MCVSAATIADFGATQNNYSDYDYFPLNYRNIGSTERSNGIDSNNLESTAANHNLNGVNGNECGGTFRDRQVILKSPQYPRPYPSNSQCIYTFYSPFVCASEFHIQFLDFSLQTSPKCIKDRLTIGRTDVLCGKVIGIMKYRAKDGILRIVFSSDELFEDRGFKLLVTRLPCVTDETDDDVPLATSTEATVEIFRPIDVQPTSTEQTFTATSNWNGVIPSHEFEPPKNYRHPFFISESQQATHTPTVFMNNNWPLNPNNVPNNVLPITPPFVSPPSNPSISPGGFSQSLPAPQPFPGLPRCCVNSFHQKRFYLVSDGFPYGGAYRSDCIYHIQRNNPNICRLRIEFKYFLLGAPHQNSFDCTQNYLEIDGHRICGCKTGMVYASQWGPGDRILRNVNAVGYAGNQGFILDVIQEECPFRLSAKREEFHSPVIDASNSRFLFAASDEDRCFFDYGQWLRLAADQLFQSKPVCIKTNF